MPSENPTLANHQLENEFSSCPSFGLYDIFNFLIYHSTDYDKQGLAAYKSFNDYRLFQDGYVESLLTKELQKEGLHLFVGKVRPAMKEVADNGKRHYELWFIIEGKGANRGSALKAYCGCKGGRDGGCKHIAAAMYSLEDLLNSRGEDSVTSVPCKWVKKCSKDSNPCDVKDLKIGKRVTIRPLTKRKNERVYCEHINKDVRHERDRGESKESQKAFTHSLVGLRVQPAILPLLAKLHNVPMAAKPIIPEQINKEEDNSYIEDLAQPTTTSTVNKILPMKS